MYNIKLLNKIASCGTDLFDAKYNVGENVEKASAIMVRSASMHEMEFEPELCAIARAGAGVNNIPLDVCAEKGIVVFNTPGANANAVKELAICALLLSSRKITAGVEWAKTLEGNEDVAKAVEKGKGQFVGPELKGKKLGVIGLGAIGVMVANTAAHLGMTVYGYDPYLTVDAAWNLSRSIVKANELKTIYENCDYISVHVPSTPETKGMFNKETYSMMKDGVRIINLSRADLFNTSDTLDAVKSGKIATYVTDFPTAETINVDNIIAIPHLGASTPESEDNCAVMAAEELIDFLENGNIRNSVNYPTVILPRSTDKRICILHKNIPSMVSQITTVLAEDKVNIENMQNKSKKEYAYTMIEVNGDVADKIIADISAIEGVIKAFVK
ncbi:MAG: 3-phosphoglycerate dehydrogenase [Ruminococcaceae bacterium]|nr:3-phosphoglycerate dehydrogenase [Oscillospiraceae bacterium]